MSMTNNYMIPIRLSKSEPSLVSNIFTIIQPDGLEHLHNVQPFKFGHYKMSYFILLPLLSFFLDLSHLNQI